MLDFAFFLSYIAIPCAGLFFLKLCYEKPNRISIVSIVFWYIYLFSIVGALPLYFEMDSYHSEYVGVTDKALILRVLLISGVNLIFFLLGIIFVRRVFRLRPLQIKSSEIEDIDFLRDVLLKIFFLVCILALSLYLTKVNRIAIVDLIVDGAGMAAFARSEMTSGFDGSYYLYALFYQEIGLFLLIASLIRYRVFGKGRLFLISLIVFYTFVSIMAIQKEPFVNMVIFLVVANYLIKTDGVVPVGSAVKVVLLLFFLLAAIFYSAVTFHSFSDALGSVFARAFAGSISPAYFYLQYYPEHQDFLLGKTIPDPLNLFGYNVSNYIVEVFEFIDPTLAKLGITGTAPTVFWGEVYANFGYSMIPFFAFAIGFVLAIVTYCVSRLKINPITLGYFVWLIYHFKILSATGFSYYIYDIFFWSVTLIVVLLSLRRWRIPLRRHGFANAKQ